MVPFSDKCELSIQFLATYHAYKVSKNILEDNKSQFVGKVYVEKTKKRSLEGYMFLKLIQFKIKSRNCVSGLQHLPTFQRALIYTSIMKHT